ncbi:uncharacterized protein EDB91DRAFT_749862 [Suillus paluster]|uniref:uncharacterized protein n=1 Tax=Suillus paluster TaxID=48578 RepID=UPI001B878FB3|nr:uncharacterized protein EDB91DRAFT_749862 [Suillus paluster]KAG1730695.1 hypothetical protein EDB91DRAFT_749862 [Suillus paluster]
MLVGGLLAFSLSGCVNMQFIVYCRMYSHERWHTKSLVIATWLLDLCHSALVAVALWDSIIATYGDLDKLDVIPWSVGPGVELTAMITFLVQSFFAQRIHKLQKKRFTIAIPIVALSFFRLVTASISMGEMLSLKSYTAFRLRDFSSWIFTLGLLLSASVDIMITTFLCYFLRKNLTSFKDTIRIIDTLTLWTIQNGSITCAAAIASLVCWKVMPQNRIFLGLHFFVAKLYANSLLATLNARKQISNGKQYTPASDQLMPPVVFLEDFEHTPESSLPHGLSMQLDARRLKAGHLRGKSIQVNVERSVESKHDIDNSIEVDLTASCTRDSPV